MAETSLEIQLGTGREVCVKRLLPRLARDAKYVERFLREGRLAARLNHENVVCVYDVGERSDGPYIAMEYVDGADLAAMLCGGPARRLPWPAVVAIAHDLASALEHAHGRGVVHRDVSPSNVLLGRAGEVKLADFGIARPIDDACGTWSGKPAYMAPEQLRAGDVDERADLYSLGMVLFEALAGQHPFADAEDLDALERGVRPPLAELAPAVPAPLVELVERLLATDPRRRWASGAAVLAALAPWSGALQEGRDALAAQVEEVAVEDAEPPAPPAGAAAPRARARWRPLGLALASAALAGVVSIGLADRAPAPVFDRADVSLPSAPAGRVLPDETAVVTRAKPKAPPSPSRRGTARRERPRAAAPALEDVEPVPGRLRVGVRPWGRVWVDGELVGEEAPVELELPPGRHWVEAGRHTPQVRESVLIDPGVTHARVIDVPLEESAEALAEAGAHAVTL